jgi:hypothetical protein
MKNTFKTFFLAPLSLLFIFIAVSCNQSKKVEAINLPKKVKTDSIIKVKSNTIDSVDYEKRMLTLSNKDTTGRWPTKTIYPLPGAILPYNRIVAFYGNLYSKRMGILGELPKDEMLKKLQGEVAKWQSADTTIKAIPALHYIAITAQGKPGKDNKYRMRLATRQIDTVIKWAKPINALVFVDIQVGHSTVKEEVATLEKYLMLPNVHLGIDPEFSMKNGETPGTKIGTFNANDINDAIDFLADIVRKNHLPPKVLVVHRFTQGMVTEYEKIKKIPEVQIVMNMDGFGDKVLKKSTYLRYIFREPVQFTGFKLFYKNDTKNGVNGMYTPEEILKFKPMPIYIQYQ